MCLSIKYGKKWSEARVEKTPRVWTWMHPPVDETEHDLEERLERLKRGGVDSIFLLVYDGRKAFYESATVPMESDQLGRVLKVAERLGLEVHAWMFTLNCNVEWVQERHPEWFVVNRKGNSTLVERPYVEYYNWLCPSRDDVVAYVLSVVHELAQVPGLAGVHLDYIRFPDVILPKGLHAHYNLVQDRELPEYDYCYCDVCRRAFREEAGRDPLEQGDPSQDAAWREFREARITRVVELAVKEIHAAGKQATAAVFATPKLAKQLVRQDWAKWPLDAVFPMIYHKFYDEPPEWIESASREGVEALRGKLPLYAGVFVPELPGDLTGEALNLALRGGAHGVSLFSAEALTDAQLTAVARAKKNAYSN